jgi:hypothetical protein
MVLMLLLLVNAQDNTTPAPAPVDGNTPVRSPPPTDIIDTDNNGGGGNGGGTGGTPTGGGGGGGTGGSPAPTSRNTFIFDDDSLNGNGGFTTASPTIDHGDVTTAEPTTPPPVVGTNPANSTGINGNSTITNTCVTSINAIAFAESQLADDFIAKTERTYILCPGNYLIGNVSIYNEQIEGGQVMIPLRPNLRVVCGDARGARENMCLIKGGDVQVDGSDRYGIANPSISNVVLQGLTFIDVWQYSAWLTKPGSVTFRDCEFRVRINWDCFDLIHLILATELTLRDSAFRFHSAARRKMSMR